MIADIYYMHSMCEALHYCFYMHVIFLRLLYALAAFIVSILQMGTLTHQQVK